MDEKEVRSGPEQQSYNNIIDSTHVVSLGMHRLIIGKIYVDQCKSAQIFKSTICNSCLVGFYEHIYKIIEPHLVA